MISASEIAFLSDGIQQGIRADGRSCDGLRPLEINLGWLPSANGSCHVKSLSCDIYVAIKCELGRPTAEHPSDGIVKVDVEFGGSVLPRFQDFTGRQAMIEADTLADLTASQITNMCLSSLDKKQLCIESGRICWIASVDVLVERIDGPMLDPISVGLRGALMDLKLPGVVPVADEEAAHSTKSIESTIPMVQLTTDLHRMILKESSALCITLGIFAGNSVIMADLDRSEENIARLKENCLLTVAISGSKECCGLHKFGLGSLDPSITHHVIQAGIQLGAQVSAVLDKLSANIEN